MFEVKDIIQLNKDIGESGGLLNESVLQSALASVPYYDTEKLALCSIVRSVMQNHPFYDGNKRTGCFMLIAGMSILGKSLDLPVATWEAFAVQSVTQRWTPEQILEWVESQ